MTTLKRFCMAVFAVSAFLLLLCILQPQSLSAQPFDSELFSGMHWRLIGPFRGGRALTATGVRGKPDLFYFGAVGGGVWKSDDAGQTWAPIFDSQPVSSIGAIAVAPSNPDILYVGSGEADMRSDISYGNGMYKSTDAGRTWARIGLEDSRQIGQILIDPRDSNRVFVAALGHAYGPNAERGVFRSVDGGKTWSKVLFKDENTGAIDLAFGSQDTQIIYASLWQTRRPPWNVYPPSNGPGSGLYKSTDGGNTWDHLTGHGLPTEGLGRIGIAVSPSNSTRIYLLVDAKEGGLYRSDDAGENFRRVATEPRLWGRGWYFGGVTVDPKDPDTVYVANTSLYRSRDGGKSFTAIKGAPGGDDYHSLWINPDDPRRMILSSDQGVIVSVNGGETWSSWYNQPTGQFYHVIADNRFPYWVYGAQQDSGAAGTTTRSDHRGISFRDWEPAAAGGESGYVATDPLNPDIVFGGTVTRYSHSTRQNQNISPEITHPDEYRRTWTLPLVFSPLDKHQLFFGTQFLFRTSDGGQTWQKISPDLSREDPGVPPNLDAPTAVDGPTNQRRGVIYAIAPSPLRAGEIWIGSDDGLIQVTHDDGKTWQNRTPQELTPWSKVGILESSRHDPNTVYAAIDRHRLEDYRPYIYRTRDGGKTWKNVTKGIPDGSFVNVVREDPVRKGLLYAGTETGVFVSFNDGDDWQPLQLNLPNASIRDLVIHEDDLIAATHGRAIWILDDVTPLRQIDNNISLADAWLFRPQTALRVRPGSDNGTPLPPEEPAGENPPSGAILDYLLKSAPSGPVTLEIKDKAGRTVRHFSSADRPARIDPNSLNIQAFWVQPPKPLPSSSGMHRFIWDLHYEGVQGARPGRFGSGAGPWAMPGLYTVKLTVADKSFTQPLTVKMDPRVKTSFADLSKQFQLAYEVNSSLKRISEVTREAARLQSDLRSLRSKAGSKSGVIDTVSALEEKIDRIAGRPASANPDFIGVGEPSSDRSSLRFLSGNLSALLGMIQSADVAPGPDTVTAVMREQQSLEKSLTQWTRIKTIEVPKLNALLRQAGLETISTAGPGR